MKRFTRVLSLLLALLTLVVAAVPAVAAERNVSILPQTLWAGCEYASTVRYENMPEEATVVSVKSGNPRVLRVEKNGSDIYDVTLIPRKPGKAKVTLKYRLNGKTKTLSATYTVKAYPKPMSSVTVNGKKIDIVSNPYYYDIEDYRKTKATVKLKLSRGWRIDSTWGFVQHPDKEDSFRDFEPVNGKSFKIPKGYNCCVFYTLVNSKGEDIQFGIRFYR